MSMPSAPTLARTTAAIVIILLLFAPAAHAAHWGLYYSGHDRTVGFTLEPDGVVVHAPGNVLHGVADRTIEAGASPGSGGLFLDAVAGTSAAGATVYPRFASGPLLDRSDILLPGRADVSAWYGWWSDLEEDGFIHDEHDACDSACPADEFRWRGVASDDAGVVLALYLVPEPRLDFVGLGNQSSYHYRTLTDFTAVHHPEQGWHGGVFHNRDGPLLMTIHTVVVAGAQPTLDGRLPYDPADAEALVDVDRYESVSGDVEVLYAASAVALRDGLDAGDRFAADSLDAYRDAARDAFALYASVFALLAEIRSEPTSAVTSATTALLPKEPNRPEDDYGGRATFGSGDLRGSGNTYAGYETQWGFYFDSRAVTRACGSAYARVEPAGVSGAFGTTCSDVRDPVAAQRAGQRSTGAILVFDALVGIWKDVNGDTYLGEACDREDHEEFDAEANTCRHATGHGSSAGDYRGEFVNTCLDANLHGHVSVEPIGGNWPGVVVMRNYRETTRVAWDLDWEVVDDDRVIELRWADVCPTTFGSLRTTRDAILFPQGGTSIAIRAESRASIPGYVLADEAVDIGPQAVRDVDVLPAVL